MTGDRITIAISAFLDVGEIIVRPVWSQIAVSSHLVWGSFALIVSYAEIYGRSFGGIVPDGNIHNVHARQHQMDAVLSHGLGITVIAGFFVPTVCSRTRPSSGIAPAPYFFTFLN